MHVVGGTTLNTPNPASGHHQPTPLLVTPGHSQASLGQSFVGSLLLSPGSWWTQGSVCALQESISESFVSSGSLHGGVDGDLFQGRLCHTQLCCTQSPCPCGSPLLTRTSTGDAQTQFVLITQSKAFHLVLLLSHVRLCNPMNRNTPGLPVHYQLPESTQTHVHWIGESIKPSHPLLSPSPPALNLSQHQGLFKWVSSSHQVPKLLEFQVQHQSFQRTPRTDLL